MTSFTVPVEASHIMMFARAIGDDNPTYFDNSWPDDRSQAGVIAPPTFLQAALHFDPSKRSGAGSDTDNIGDSYPGSRSPDISRLLHAEQHFEYFRPIRSGDILVAESRPGATWEKQSRRAGLLRFYEKVTDFRIRATWELVATSRTIIAETERAADSRGD